MEIENLVGKWNITRIISHPDGTPKGRMQGMGYYGICEENQLLYQEQLLHTTDEDGLFFATKFYRYHFKKKEISIYFYQEEEGRLFMTLPKNDLRGDATCKEDRYSLVWDWVNPETFLTRYTAVGPQKNYIIESEFKR